jgi:hypothetical protein
MRTKDTEMAERWMRLADGRVRRRKRIRDDARASQNGRQDVEAIATVFRTGLIGLCVVARLEAKARPKFAQASKYKAMSPTETQRYSVPVTN